MEQKNPVEISIYIKAIVLLVQSVAGFGLVYAGIDREIFSILAALLLIDFVTGTWKAHTLGRRVRSNRMKYGVISKLSLLIIPIAIGLGVRAIGQDAEMMILVAMNILILSEVYSIIGNIYVVRTGIELPEYDALTAIAKSIRRRLEGESKSDLEEKKDGDK